MNRSRWMYAAAVVATLAAGLASRAVAAALPGWLAKNAGDALYATMVFFAVGVVAPRVRTRTAAALALACCFAIEGSHLYHVPWLDAVRDTVPGYLALGQGFHALDLVCYTIGVALGATIEVRAAHAGHELVRWLAGWIWGYDLFISYQWSTGGSYAVALAARMRERGFTCFLDRAEYASGDDWREVGRRALRHAQRLVVIATLDAMTHSKPVADEIEAFARRKDHIFLIVFGAHFTEDQYATLTTLVTVSPTALTITEAELDAARQPSGGVINELERSYKVLRRRRLRTWLAGTAIAVLAIALLVALVARSSAANARDAETQARQLAEQRERVAISRQLAAQAHATGGHPLRAIDLARGALAATTASGEPPTRAAEQALRDALAVASGRAIAGHTEPVRAIAVAADGALLATASSDRTVAVWRFDADGTPTSPTYLPHPSPASWLGFAGPRLVTAARDHVVRIWDVGATPRPAPQTTKLRAAFESLAISPDAGSLAIIDDAGHVRLWQLGRPAAPTRDLDTSIHATDAVFTRDARWLIVYSKFEKTSDQSDVIAADSIALRYDLYNLDQPPARLLHGARIAAVAAAPAPRPAAEILTAGADGKVQRWDVSADHPSGRAIACLDSRKTGAVESIAYLGDGAIAGSHDGVVACCSLDGGRAGSWTRMHASPVRIASSVDHLHAISYGVRDSVAQVWDASCRGAALAGHTGAIELAMFVPGMARAVTTADDKSARVWNLDPLSQDAVLIGHEDTIQAAVVTPDGTRLFAATGTEITTQPQIDSYVRMWKLSASQSSTFPIEIGVHKPETSLLLHDGRSIVVAERTHELVLHALSSDLRSDTKHALGMLGDDLAQLLPRFGGRELVAVVQDGEIASWSLDAPDLAASRHVLARHPFSLLHAELSPDERWVAAGDNHAGGGIWPLVAGKRPIPITAPGGVTALAYRPDGAVLAVADDEHGVRLVSTRDGSSTPLDTLEESVGRLVFSADGRWLVAVPNYIHDVALWRVAEDGVMQRPTRLPCDGEPIRQDTVAFDASSSRLLWATDHHLHVLDLATTQLSLIPSGDSAIVIARWLGAGRIAVGHMDGGVEIWRVSGATHERVWHQKHDDEIDVIEPVGEDRVAVASSDGAIILWDTRNTGDDVRVVLQQLGNPASWLSMTSDGRWLFAGTPASVKIFPLVIADLLSAAALVAPSR